MIVIQKYLRFFAAVDLMLFFIVLIGSSVTERIICKGESIDVPYLDEYLQIPSHVQDHHYNNNSSNSTDEYNSTETTSATEVHKTHKTIWDYRVEFLNRAKGYSIEAYHVVYISIWALFVAYIVVEIWLYCVLIIGITSKQIRSCRKWLAWKTIILAIGLVACGYEIFKFHSVTCTAAIALPYGIFRLILTFSVIEFMTKLKRSSSTDTIVMTGSEKL